MLERTIATHATNARSMAAHVVLVSSEYIPFYFQSVHSFGKDVDRKFFLSILSLHFEKVYTKYRSLSAAKGGGVVMEQAEADAHAPAFRSKINAVDQVRVLLDTCAFHRNLFFLHFLFFLFPKRT